MLITQKAPLVHRSAMETLGLNSGSPVHSLPQRGTGPENGLEEAVGYTFFLKSFLKSTSAELVMSRLTREHCLGVADCGSEQAAYFFLCH